MFDRLRRSLIARSVACLAAAAALAATGCGDGGGDGIAEETKVSWANESPRDFASRLAKLLETTRRGDCTDLAQISQRSLTAFTCPPDRSLARSMARFRFLDSEEHGPGAIVDYTSGSVADGAAIVLAATPDREWGVVRFGVFSEHSVGTSDRRSREGFESAVAGYLSAVRERDCKAIARLELSGGIYSDRSCKERLADTRDLAKRLKANPDANAAYKGGNSVYGFHTLETAKPKPLAHTIVSLDQSAVRATAAKKQGYTGGRDQRASYAVLDAAPSPTAADQRKRYPGFQAG